ncbi:hypothetical protein MLD52_19415 [Puniceicoccaceae bacterium K14]|nr:hypothetical protein [Puniceicoccaceae bacterium K14]
MSEKIDNTELESEALEASDTPMGELKLDGDEPTAKPIKSEPASATKSVFGTRKSKPGAAAGSNVKPLSQIRGAFDDDDDEIEMDDLPVRATAPAHLVENENRKPSRERDENRDGESRRGPRRDRERSKERSRKPRAERTPTENAEEAAAVEANAIEEKPETFQVEETEDRPERFGTVSEQTLEARKSVQEFRPSKDGRRAKKTTEKRGERPSQRQPKKAPKKKGFFAWLKSLFVAEKVEEKPKRNNRGPRQGQGRSQGGQGGEQRRRRRRPNNGPRRDGNRPQGENQNRPRGDRGENGDRPRNNRRRRSGGGNRRPRPEGERKPTSAE